MDAIALIHTEDSNSPDGTTTRKMSATNLDIEVHDGDLVLFNGDEEIRVPIGDLVTLEIRPNGRWERLRWWWYDRSARPAGVQA